MSDVESELPVDAVEGELIFFLLRGERFFLSGRMLRHLRMMALFLVSGMQV